MAAIVCEQQKFLEELDILKKKAKCLQQEVECLELERTNCATEEERLQSQKKLDSYEQRMRELERCLLEKTRQVEEAKECYRSLRQELHQFNIRLECTRKRKREKKDCVTNDGDYDNRDNKSKTTKQPNSTATQATVVASSSAVKAPPSAAASKTKTSDQQLPSPPPPQQQQSKQQQQQEEQQQQQEQQQETGASDRKSRSSSAIPNELHDPSETSPDCIDAPPGINQEPPDSSTAVRICEISLKGKYIRLVNASSEEKDVGGHFIVQRKQDGPTSVFQFPGSVPLPGKATVTVWSAGSGTNRNSPPTDFVFSAQQEWLTGADCTTVLCRPNQQAMSWLTSNSSSTVGPICAGIQPNDVKQETKVKVEKEEKEEDRRDGKKGEEMEEKKGEGRKEEEGKKKAKDEKDEDKKTTKRTDEGRTGGKDGKGQKKISKSRSRSRSRSRKNKNKIKMKKTKEGRIRHLSEECEEVVEVDECCGQREMDSSSDDCKGGGGGRMCEEEVDECEEEILDCWWGERRCSLDKTIPCASVHLGDDAQTRTKGQRSKVSECHSNGVNECASSASSDCYEPPQKQTKQTKDRESVRSPSRKVKADKSTIESICPPSTPPPPPPPAPKKTKEKQDDCRSRGRGGLRSGRTKVKRLKEDFGCCSNSSQELRARNKNRSCKEGSDEFFVCPCDLDECQGQGSGQGWLGSWAKWFSRRCAEEEDKKRTKDKGGCCEDKKALRGICCEEKKAPRGICCEEKKAPRGICCEEKKAPRGICCEEKKAPRGICCEEKKAPRGICCEEKKAPKGGCCEEKNAPRGGCCEDDKVTRSRRMWSGTCEEKEEECIDPCQQILRKFESDCGVLSSRSNPHLASGMEGGRRSARGVSLGGVAGGGGLRDEFGCPCACRQSDSFAVTTASLMAAGLTVAAMYCA